MERMPANFNWQSLPALLEILVKLIESLSIATSKSNLRTDPTVAEHLGELKKVMAEFTKKEEK